MKLLGFDLGSSFIKSVIIDSDTGRVLASAQYPDREMVMVAPQAGWAEQDPEEWWMGVRQLTKELVAEAGNDIGSIGISYQMHGLVLVDRNLEVLRPAIIWCDSRAASIGNAAFSELGEKHCLEHYLNSPGNFTASKMKWVLDHEPAVMERCRYAMLPGDFITMRLTGEATTTASGLSEMILWDFKGNHLAGDLLEFYGLPPDIIPDIVQTFTDQLVLGSDIAEELGLPAGIPVSYRAGDQPNNALSLNVFEPGEIAATAGTSGVVYGVTDKRHYDPSTRVNSFVHVNHTIRDPRLGVLMCVNGTGIMNRWARENFGWNSYEEMNDAARAVKPGAEGIRVYPFGNGSERILENKYPGASIEGIDLNRHGRAHIARAVHEGIAFALNHGLNIMGKVGIEPRKMRAGTANMFLNPSFGQLMSDLSGVPIELMDTNGAVGAALGAGLGGGQFKSREEAFRSLAVKYTLEPEYNPQLEDAYKLWNEKIRTWSNN